MTRAIQAAQAPQANVKPWIQVHVDDYHLDPDVLKKFLKETLGGELKETLGQEHEFNDLEVSVVFAAVVLILTIQSLARN